MLHRRLDGRDERGQTIVLVALLLPMLLAMVGLVLDVGHAYSVQRRLQASADSAALAGAAQLPSVSNAVAMATNYGAAPGERNALGEPVTEDVSTRCLTSFPGCSTANAVSVDETAKVSTYFARVFGVGTVSVHAKSTACSPCGAKPLDIVIVLDRTLSMCMNDSYQLDPGYPDSCVDLTNARNGITTFLQLLDPSLDHVALAVLPPAPTTSKLCAAPPLQTAYNSKSSPYVLVPLSSNYASKAGTLNPSSALISTLNCVQPGGETAYALAIEAAQAELRADGRAGVTKVILFFSDGAANTGPNWLPTSSPYLKTPCHQGVASAGVAKSAGTLIYSVGYDLNGGANTCQSESAQGPPESPSITATQALEGIASGPSYFYDQPTASQVNTLFANLAANMLAGTANLISNDTP